MLALVGGCSSETGVSGSTEGNFTLRSAIPASNLVEGEAAGLTIPLNLTRSEGHTALVSLSIEGVRADDSAFISSAFSRNSLSQNVNQSNVNLRLDVGVLPILPQQRQFRITASDGVNSDSVFVTVNVTPVQRPDVYLLIGQSNMVGFGGDGDKQQFPGGLDEKNPRILQLNVTRNNEFIQFSNGSDFVNVARNVGEPQLVQAEDPLHVPVDPSTLAKEENYIGLGLSFAKEALNATTSNIVLVPAAWAGTSFCNTNDFVAQWNALPTSKPFHGNTLLFDRALTRINHALNISGGILRGILWHQGESDANDECYREYADNLKTLVAQLRSRITPDVRGASGRGPGANIPFVVGTMSRGFDDRGDLSQYGIEKTTIDSIHRSVGSLIPHSDWSNHDDLVPTNGFGCGNTTCIHFGSTALREMGRRYHVTLLRAANGS